jgi:uncharacterized protein GlcG (DUF336 family)
MNIAVVDAGTNLVAFAHMDDAWLVKNKTITIKIGWS